MRAEVAVGMELGNLLRGIRHSNKVYKPIRSADTIHRLKYEDFAIQLPSSS